MTYHGIDKNLAFFWTNWGSQVKSLDKEVLTLTQHLEAYETEGSFRIKQGHEKSTTVAHKGMQAVRRGLLAPSSGDKESNSCAKRQRPNY